MIVMGQCVMKETGEVRKVVQLAGSYYLRSYLHVCDQIDYSIRLNKQEAERSAKELNDYKGGVL